MKWRQLIMIFFVAQCNCKVNKGRCDPEMVSEVLRKFVELCPYSSSAKKRDINQDGFWYYKLNRYGMEPGNNELSNNWIRNPNNQNQVPVKNSGGNNGEIYPWQTMSWFNLAPPTNRKSKFDEDLDFAQIELLVDPLNYGGSEIDVPIERWRRLSEPKKRAFSAAVSEFIDTKCCNTGCHFPTDYLPYAKAKDMFNLLEC